VGACVARSGPRGTDEEVEALKSGAGVSEANWLQSGRVVGNSKPNNLHTAGMSTRNCAASAACISGATSVMVGAIYPPRVCVCKSAHMRHVSAFSATRGRLLSIRGGLSRNRTELEAGAGSRGAAAKEVAASVSTPTAKKVLPSRTYGEGGSRMTSLPPEGRLTRRSAQFHQHQSVSRDIHFEPAAVQYHSLRRRQPGGRPQCVKLLAARGRWTTHGVKCLDDIAVIGVDA